MFCVRPIVIQRMTGRTRGGVNMDRQEGRVPSVLRDDGSRLYDIDDPNVQKYIRTPLKTATAAKLLEAKTYAEEFVKRRQRGEVVCEMTGQADYMSSIESGIGAYLQSAADAELDTIKKKKEIEKLDRTVERMDIQMKAMTGDLIERDYAAAFIRRYVGMLHKVLLDMAGSGLCVDLMNVAMKHKDDVLEGEKALEKALSVKVSDSIKGALSAMEQNPL